MEAEGHCAVRLTRRYPEPPAEVWEALTEPDSLARWLRPGFDVLRFWVAALSGFPLETRS
jgi:uncharacterized protein YndB with AHSA1/START domain